MADTPTPPRRLRFGLQLQFVVMTVVCMWLAPTLSSGLQSAELTATEQLIRSEVIRLGGSWEASGDNQTPVMISFYGNRFKERHFEMLEHVRSAKMLACVGVDVGRTALGSIAHMADVEKIHIQEGSFSGEGCGALRRLTSLTSLKVYDCRLTREGVLSIARMQSLTELVLDDVDLPGNVIADLGALQNLRQLIIHARGDCDESELKELRSRLPECQVTVEPVKKVSP